MNFYEHTYITSPELSSQETDSVRKKITDILEKNDGKILKEEDWGIRSLAYPIKKSSKGNTATFILKATTR